VKIGEIIREKSGDYKDCGFNNCLTFLRRAKVIISGAGSSMFIIAA
jgi:hypothetical protein